MNDTKIFLANLNTGEKFLFQEGAYKVIDTMRAIVQVRNIHFNTVHYFSGSFLITKF